MTRNLNYLLNHRKHRYELVDEPNKQFNTDNYFSKKTILTVQLAIKVIMNGRRKSAINLKQD